MLSNVIGPWKFSDSVGRVGGLSPRWHRAVIRPQYSIAMSRNSTAGKPQANENRGIIAKESAESQTMNALYDGFVAFATTRAQFSKSEKY
jgi:hypothetical protein